MQSCTLCAGEQLPQSYRHRNRFAYKFWPGTGNKKSGKFSSCVSRAQVVLDETGCPDSRTLKAASGRGPPVCAALAAPAPKESSRKPPQRPLRGLGVKNRIFEHICWNFNGLRRSDPGTVWFHLFYNSTRRLNTMKNIKFVVYKEEKYYVSQCLNVDVSSFGETIDEAISALKEAVSLYFEDESSGDEYQVIGETLLGEDVIHA
jgi:predicted RNase H-like HicB family nuclease